MIEKLCPVHNVPVFGEKCSKDGCDARPLISTTIYWCSECNIPIFEKTCSCCGNEGEYVATDMRPVFPEEKLLLGILLEKEDPYEFNNSSIWNCTSGYIIDGKKVSIGVREQNNKPIEEMKKIKEKYEEYKDKIDRSYFDCMIERFIEANKDRYYSLTDEAIAYIQSFSGSYTLDEMFVSFSGGKDSTVTSDLVTRAFATNKIKDTIITKNHGKIFGIESRTSETYKAL